MYKTLDCTIPELPENKPRYLMRVGTPENIITAIGKGIDMFDCVYPTRNARHGQVYTWKGKINIKRIGLKTQDSPIDKDCKCYACKITQDRIYIF